MYKTKTRKKFRFGKKYFKRLIDNMIKQQRLINRYSHIIDNIINNPDNIVNHNYIKDDIFIHNSN